MLLKLALAVDPYRKAAFIEYYVNENSNVFEKNDLERDIKKVFKDGLVFKEGIEIQPVPKIHK